MKIVNKKCVHEGTGMEAVFLRAALCSNQSARLFTSSTEEFHEKESVSSLVTFKNCLY